MYIPMKMSKMRILKNILKSVSQIFNKSCPKIDFDLYLKYQKLSEGRMARFREIYDEGVRPP